MREVRVRVAPSPTGDPHVGTAYIALFNYLFAKRYNGKFILRIEDTDRERFNASSERKLLEYLAWLGLQWDEGPDIGGEYGPYRQSEREYKEYADMLLENGTAYRCFCTKERLDELREFQKSKKLPTGYDRKCRDIKKDESNRLAQEKEFVVRLKVPTRGKIEVSDKFRGSIEFDLAKIDDQILLKRDKMPTYHLANVVDDHLMKITDVIRAEEWIPSTPKHILLYRAFGWTEPTWMHMPLLRNNDRSKISKRKNDVSLEVYHDKGYIKEAMLNFLALMGWSTDSEIFTLDHMIENFDIEKIHLGSPIFDVTKLNWVNREHIRVKSGEELLSLLKLESSKTLLRAVDAIKDNYYTLNELKDHLLTLTGDVAINIEKSKGENISRVEKILSSDKKDLIVNYLKENIQNFNSFEEAKLFVDEMKEKLSLKPGELYPVIRILITGLLKGPEIALLLHIFQKEEILKRV